MLRNLPIMIACLILAGTLGCRRSSKTETTGIVYAPTSIGTPVGVKITKEIGPAGGTLSSPDGRLTIAIPPNALSSITKISIQPITNTAPGGLGNAYRFEPNGQKFDLPAEITLRFTANDVDGSAPDFLAVAFQDEHRVWQDLRTTRLDATARTVSGSTLHFTDMSFLQKMHISPQTATVRVGESISLELVGCKIETDFRGRESCMFNADDPNYDFARRGNWYADIGIIDNPRAIRILYTAPPKRPSPNVANVSFPYDVPEFDETKGHKVAYGWFIAPLARTWVRGLFTAKITIIDWGYRASGRTGDLVYSGVICDLAKPFTVNGSLINYKFNFTPSSATAGTFSITAGGELGGGVFTAQGGGTYKIEGADTDKPRIALTGAASGTGRAYGRSASGTGSGTTYIDLTPLSGNECR